MKRFLFQGDSITDAFRLKDSNLQYFGYGYATMVAGQLHQKHPGQFEFFNRGVSGDRTVDLYARIKKDVINLKPDYMSLLVGVNDIGHDFTQCNGVSPEKYEKMLTMYLSEIQEALPNIKIVILEPFIADGEFTREQGPELRPQIEKVAAAAKRVAEKFNFPFVPLQKTFDAWVQKYGETYVTHEGVHPTNAGHSVIANALVETLEKEVF